MTKKRKNEAKKKKRYFMWSQFTFVTFSPKHTNGSNSIKHYIRLLI